MDSRMVAYQGKDGCESVLCASIPGPDGSWECVGWHCAFCGEPSSYQGHPDCLAQAEGGGS